MYVYMAYGNTVYYAINDDGLLRRRRLGGKLYDMALKRPPVCRFHEQVITR